MNSFTSLPLFSRFGGFRRIRILPRYTRRRMLCLVNVNPTSEHDVFLQLFASNSGGT
jgi:hypothetical protein